MSEELSNILDAIDSALDTFQQKLADPNVFTGESGRAELNTVTKLFGDIAAELAHYLSQA